MLLYLIFRQLMG